MQILFLIYKLLLSRRLPLNLYVDSEFLINFYNEKSAYTERSIVTHLVTFYFF